MGSERAVEPFLVALQDEDEFVRWIAAKSSWKIKSDRVSERFTDILRIKAITSEGKQQRLLNGVFG